MIRSIIAYTFCVLLSQCSGSSDDEESPKVEIRRGSELQQFEFTAFRGRPSLSADGTQLIFISSQNGSMQAFTLQVPIGATPKDPATPLLPKGVVDQQGKAMPELRAWIAPNGKQIALLTQGDGKFHLFLVNSSGTEVRKLGDFLEAPNNLVFSDDSALLAVTVNDPDNSKIYVGDVLSATLTALADLEVKRGLGFSAASKPYQLLALKEAKSQRSIVSLELSSADSSPKETSVATLGSQFSNQGELESVTNEGLFLVQRLLDAKPLVAAQGNASAFGDAKAKKRASVLAVNDLNLLDTSSGTISAVARERVGFRIRSVSASKASKLGVFLSQVSTQCFDSAKGSDTEQTYGTAMIFFSLDTATFDWIIPKTDKQSNWTTVPGPCEHDFVNETLDLSIREVAINSLATQNKARIAYISGIKGASTVFLLDSMAGTITVHEL